VANNEQPEGVEILINFSPAWRLAESESECKTLPAMLQSRKYAKHISTDPPTQTQNSSRPISAYSNLWLWPKKKISQLSF